VAALRNELDALLDVQRTRGMLPFAFMSLKLIEARYLFAQGRRDEAKACIDAASALLPPGLLPTAPTLGQLRSVEAL